MNRLTAIALALGTGIFFGYWQASLLAGVFMFFFMSTLAVIKTVE